LTAEHCHSAQKYAKVDQATLLLVGDLAKIGPGLKQLGAGEITVLDTDGNPISMRRESP